MVEETELGLVARRVKFQEARRHFLDGGRVLVSEHGDRLSIPVTNLTTTHAGDAAAWDELVANVRMWRNRYPNQRYYVIEEDE